MAITQEFNLNMIPDSAPVVVHVNQYDESEGRLIIHLLDGMVPYVPSAGAEAIIQGTKPDGKGFDYNATLSGSTVTANVTKQMTAVCGSVRTQVVITEGDNITGTFVFDLVVQKSGLPAETDMSESDYQIVEQMIEAAEEAEAISTQSAEDSEAWATGKRSGQDVPSTDPTYHNNSKYWADKAHEELENKADLVDGKVPASQLPSYVDDTVEGYYNPLDGKFYEESTYETEIEGERGKIYIDLATDKSYRWSGSAFVVINDPDIAENTLNSITASTATYPEFSAGETLKVIFGKIKKFISDLHDKKADKVSGATSGNVATLDANGNLVDSNMTLGKSVPSDAVFTDTNTKVTQTNTTGSADYRVLLSENANDTTQTVGARKSTNFKANPSTGVLSTPKVKISKSANALITGSGTAGSDKGSGVSPRYYPAKWTFNLGGDPNDGDIITIKIPVAGGTYSEWLSTDNGTTYHPIALNGKSRITSQYGVNTYLTLIYESSGVCTTYALAGADSTADVTGTWRVINYYDSNTTYSSMSQSEATTGTATTGRLITAKVLNDTISNKIGTTVSVSHTLSASANTNFDFTNIGADAVITEILATDGRGYARREYINSGTGIRFVFAPDSSTPSVTVQIRYR